MTKQKRDRKTATFAMTDEVKIHHRPRNTYPHLVTEVIDTPNRSGGLVFELTHRLTPFAHRCLGIASIDPRDAQQY